MMIMLLSVATAGEPNRCLAAWSGTAEGCNVRETFDIASGGSSEKSAEKATRAALEAALRAYTIYRKLQSPLADPAETASCDARAADAHVNCFPDATLADPKYCYVALDSAECWTGEVIKFELTGYKAWDRGRKDMCAAVDKHLVAQNYTELELRRTKCAAECAAHTKVNCP
ncbi:MAG: hypothetical protein FJ090_05470 [Deltaproteobacteria bacterium]|nr:hypothetical protein [Deltaproteobacteria bacterium]